ncbi:hypothetical protein LINGRAHAP2_LOCUS3042, partial [Linum grandiflorum]
SCSRWHRPPVGTVTLNIDASLFATQCKFGIGLALRGRAGQLMGFKQLLFDGFPEPKVGEARALSSNALDGQASLVTRTLWWK